MNNARVVRGIQPAEQLVDPRGRSRGRNFTASRSSVRHEAPPNVRAHLNRKLQVRDSSKLRSLSRSKLQPHPMLRVVAGDIERWERRPHGR
jgi:hypothetical protein